MGPKPQTKIQVGGKKYFNLDMKLIFWSRLDFKYWKGSGVCGIGLQRTEKGKVIDYGEMEWSMGKIKNFLTETIPEYMYLFLMSFSLPQYLKNMVLGWGTEGFGLGINRDWTGLQEEEPRCKVIWQCPCVPCVELKLKAWQAVQVRCQTKGEKDRA